MNVTLVLMHLFSALATCRNACARTREMVAKAINRYLELCA